MRNHWFFIVLFYFFCNNLFSQVGPPIIEIDINSRTFIKEPPFDEKFILKIQTKNKHWRGLNIDLVNNGILSTFSKIIPIYQTDLWYSEDSLICFANIVK